MAYRNRRPQIVAEPAAPLAVQSAFSADSTSVDLRMPSTRRRRAALALHSLVKQISGECVAVVRLDAP